jgi:hypothetical protein
MIIEAAPRRRTAMRRRRTNSRRGSILVLVVIVGAVVAMVALSSFSLTVQGTRLTGRSYDFKRALAVAEAGVEFAIHELNQSAVSGSYWTSVQTIDDYDGDNIGQFEVTIYDADQPVMTIESTGYVPSANNTVVERSVRVTASRDIRPPLFDWAIHSRDYLKLGSDYFMDSYDSELGPYPGIANGNANCNVAGAGNGEFSGNIQLHGSMQLGGSSTSNDPNIHGDDSEGNPNELIENVAPTSPPAFPDADLAAAQAAPANSQMTIDGTPYAGGTSLTVGSNATIVMPPGDYYFTRFELGSNCTVQVAPAGEVNVFIRASSSGSDAIKIGSNLTLNANTADPGNFTFLVKQGKVEIQSDGLMYCGLFAPDSPVLFQSNHHFYGAVVANGFEMQSNENFHYDEALGRPRIRPGGVLVTGWSEVVLND